jgi:cobalt/nickel transport system permease protein
VVLSPELEHAAYGNRSVLRKMHAVIKLLMAMIYLFINIKLGYPNYLFFFGFVVLLYISAMIPPGIVKRPFYFAFIIASVLFAAKLHFAKTGQPAHFLIDFYPAAMADSIVAALRVITGVALILILAATTPVNEILSALHLLKVPKTFIETFLVIYKYIFLFNDDGIRLRNAQMVRQGYRGFRLSLESLGNLAGMLFLRGMNRGAGMVDAMTVRGYKGDIFFPTELNKIGVKDYALLVFAGLIPLVLSFAEII